MIRHRHVLNNRRWLLVFVAAVFVGAVAGAGRAYTHPGGGPLPRMGDSAEGGAEDLVAARPGIQVSRPGDDALEFPPGLQELPGGPHDITLDARSGLLWFSIIGGAAGPAVLYRYDIGTGEIRSFAITSTGGSGLFSAIAVDGRGHPIIAEGYQILDFDPATGEARAIPLSASGNEVKNGPEGTWVTDMEMGQEGRVYVSRMNVAAITEVDLATGDQTEIPFPREFAPAYDIALSGTTLWVSNPFGSEDGATRGTTALNVVTGEVAELADKVASMAVGPDGVYATGAWPSGLAMISLERLSSPVPMSPSGGAGRFASGTPLSDVLTADPTRKALWVASQTPSEIVRIDLDKGGTQRYQLPAYLVEPLTCPLGDPQQCSRKAEAPSVVAGLAVAPNGDLYFSDATLNRIGVIRAGR